MGKRLQNNGKPLWCFNMIYEGVSRSTASVTRKGTYRLHAEDCKFFLLGARTFKFTRVRSWSRRSWMRARVSPCVRAWVTITLDIGRRSRGIARENKQKTGASTVSSSGSITIVRLECGTLLKKVRPFAIQLYTIFM